MPELRVLSYNVRSLRDDREAVAAVIRACAPDVVAVQEAPRLLRWRSKRAALARLSGLVVATADRPGGLLVMTSIRARVVSTAFSLLPKTPRLHQRAVCQAVVELDGARWRVASVHLGGDADERARHLAPLWSALDVDDGVPVVLGGDFNETPDQPVWRELAVRMQDAWAVAGTGSGYTNRALDPHRRIDGIFADPRVTVAECRAVDDVPGVDLASDHLPVLAVLRQSERR